MDRTDVDNKNPIVKGYSNALHDNNSDGQTSVIEMDKDGAIHLAILPNNGDKKMDSPLVPVIENNDNNDDDNDNDNDDDGWMESEDEKSNDDDDAADDENNDACYAGRLLGRLVHILQKCVNAFFDKFHTVTRGYFFTAIFVIAYMVYFILALNYRFGDEGSHRLLGCTVVGLVIWMRNPVRRIAKKIWTKLCASRGSSDSRKLMISRVNRTIKWILYLVLAVVVIWTIVDEGIEKPANLRSLPGLLCFVLVCLFFSSQPSKINWHTIYWSLGLQFIFALYALRWQKGKESIIWVQDRLNEFFANSKAGSILLFGESYTDHQIIFGAFPTFIFTNATIYILYYLGVMQFIVRLIGNFLKFVLHTSPVESISVAAGIFLEGLASIAALRPYMMSCSKSQMFLIMTSTFASLGGGYLSILSSISIPLEFLIAAMVISAPATFTVCKLLVPETRQVDEDKEIDVGDEEKKKYTSIMDAAQAGAVAMLTLVGHAAVNAFAVWSFVSWINSTLTWFGDRVGIHQLTIELISSYLFYPVSLAMGIESEDCRSVAMLLGYRVSSTNLVAFIKMMQMKGNRYQYKAYMQVTNFTGPISYKRDDIILDLWNVTLQDGFMSERSEAIATYSLTGFSSIASAAILIGLLYAIVPKRKKWIAKNAMLAMLAGNVANCMTGCFASLYY